MIKLNLTPTLYRSRPDKKGLCQIRIRSCVKRKVTYFTTGIKVKPEQWGDREVIAHINKGLINAAIRDQLYEIERNYIEGNLSFRKPTTKTFYSYCEEKIEEDKALNAHGTWIHKKAYLKKLRSFNRFIDFRDISPTLMYDYEKYCRELGNKPNTVVSSVKFIRIMINSALKDKILRDDPLRGWTGKPYVHPVREYLRDDEIESIENFAASCEVEKLKNVALWFLFGCYSGLRYSDIALFDSKKIVNDRIILRTHKSRADVSIKIHPRLKSVLDRMSFSVYSNQKMNDYLKIVAERCGIKRDISFHLSRHTFAVYFLNHGGSMETLSALLGHNSLRTTAIYGKITNIRIDAEIDKVFN